MIRDESAVTGAGSAVDRLVIRTRNDDPAKDRDPPTSRAERHVLPPRTSVELGERLGMFDTPTGKLHSDAATWNLIAKRDAAELNHVKFEVAGHRSRLPARAGRERRAALPPDSHAARRSATCPRRRLGRSGGRRRPARRQGRIRPARIPTRARAPPRSSPSARTATGRTRRASGSSSASPRPATTTRGRHGIPSAAC